MPDMCVSCFPPGGGKPRLMARECPTCIYLPGNRMHLTAGRLRQMTTEALQQGSQGVICHVSLPYGDYPDFGPALCRSFYDKYGVQSNFIRVMMRIGGFDEVSPPEGDE